MNTFKDYLSKGWSVFPVAGPEYAADISEYKTWKVPLVKWDVYQERHPTLAEIEAWEKKWPKCWIGCATGPISDIIVIDVDGEEGIKSLEKMPPMPLTTCSKTRRGYHYFFKWNEKLNDYVTTASGILAGIDIRGKGGYVILPS